MVKIRYRLFLVKYQADRSFSIPLFSFIYFSFFPISLILLNGSHIVFVVVIYSIFPPIQLSSPFHFFLFRRLVQFTYIYSVHKNSKQLKSSLFPRFDVFMYLFFYSYHSCALFLPFSFSTPLALHPLIHPIVLQFTLNRFSNTRIYPSTFPRSSVSRSPLLPEGVIYRRVEERVEKMCACVRNWVCAVNILYIRKYIGTTYTYR